MIWPFVRQMKRFGLLKGQLGHYKTHQYDAKKEKTCEVGLYQVKKQIHSKKE